MARTAGLLVGLWIAIFPVYRADNLELLLGTLRTHQKAACDEEMVTLICPRGTTISIQVAQYGASVKQGSCASELAQYQPVAVEVVGDTMCAWPSALQTVVEACQKKRQCKFHTSPKAFGVDPCPGSRRFVEVAYKCRPYEFRSKVGCENDVLHLSCNPHSRVAIYSAQYGRTEYDSIQCPQPRGMKEETCLEPYATETAMRECHGKRRCVLAADSNMFGKPCRTGSRTYLKVVYTCVPRTVLKERYESAPEEDEAANDVSDLEHDDVDDSSDRWWGESAVPPAPAVAAVPPQRPSMSTSINATSREDPSSSPPRQTAANNDEFDMMYVYIIAAVSVAFLLCILVGIIRCVMHKQTTAEPKGPDVSATTELPNGFNDSISEVDNDINITSLSGPVDTVDCGMKPEFTNVSISPKINRNPNDPSATPPPRCALGEEPHLGPDQTPYWDTYDTINQLYMEISGKPEMRSHYRGHKMSLWLSLIPQLHRPGADLPDPAMRHHHFQDENANYYEGAVRPQTMSRAHVPHVVSAEGARGAVSRSTAPPRTAAPRPAPVPSTECPPNATATPAQPDDALLRRLASSHYQSYTAALTVTIAVGCFLLLLNVLIFAGIYHQRGSRPRRSKDDLAEAGSSSSSDNYDGKLDYEVRAFNGKGYGFECKSAHVPHPAGSKFDLRTLSDCGEPTFGEYSCYDEKHRAARSSLPDVSVGSALEAGSVVCIDTQKPDIQKVDSRLLDPVGKTSTFEPRVVDSSTQVKFGPCSDSPEATSDTNGEAEASGSGILRAPPAAAAPAPPGIMKKRVQIQEISV